MPRSGRLGFELFDKLSWGQTEFDEKVNYQRALEGELERTIQTLKDVESVRVHLVMPADSLFLDRERSAKASVILKLRGRMSPETASWRIARLVSGAVDRLSPESVTVVDANSDRSASHAAPGCASRRRGTWRRSWQRASATTLEPMTGRRPRARQRQRGLRHQQQRGEPGDLRSQSRSGSVDATPGGAGRRRLCRRRSRNRQQCSQRQWKCQGDGAVGRRLAGFAQRCQHLCREARWCATRCSPRAASGASPPRWWSTTPSRSRRTRKARRTETRRKRTPEELKQIQELAQAAIGFDAQRGDDGHRAEPLLPEAAGGSSAEAYAHASGCRSRCTTGPSLVRYGALLLLFLLAYVLLLRPVKKQILATMKQLPARRAAAQAEAGAGAGIGAARRAGPIAR